MTVGGEGEAEGRGMKGWGEKKRERRKWEGGEKRERLGNLPILRKLQVHVSEEPLEDSK